MNFALKKFLNFYIHFGVPKKFFRFHGLSGVTT